MAMTKPHWDVTVTLMEKTYPNPTYRSKRGVKRSVLTEGHGVPIGRAIEGAQRHGMKLIRPTK
jgi:putative transposase